MSLMVDEWIYDMLNDGSPGTEVEVFQNGTYKWLKSKTVAVELDCEESHENLDNEEKSAIKHTTEAMNEIKLE